MTNKLIPNFWRDDLEHRPNNRYALIEMGALPPASRTALIEAANAYWPLITKTNQEHLVREGPWLIAFPDTNADWQGLSEMRCGLKAWIESPRSGSSLAAQLAPALTLVSPEGKSWLLRYYLPPIINMLHGAETLPWHRELFNGIDRWWFQADDHKWQFLEGLPDDGLEHAAWRLESDASLWSSLTNNTEAMTLTSLFVRDMPRIFEGICPCDRPRKVAKALEAADESQLSRPEDRRIYAYLWLAKGEKYMKESTMKACAEQANKGTNTLLECLEVQKED